MLTLLHEAPETHWPEIPSQRSLQAWRNDVSIVADSEFVEQFGNELKADVVGQVRQLLVALSEYILEVIGEEGNRGKPLDILNLTKSYGITVDKVQPSRYTGTNVFDGPVQIGGVQQVIMPYGPTPPKVEEQPETIAVESEPVE